MYMNWIKIIGNESIDVKNVLNILQSFKMKIFAGTSAQ